MNGSIRVTCGTLGCPRVRTVINEITGRTPRDIELTLDGWGHGGEERADCCPECGRLGDVEVVEA